MKTLTKIILISFFILWTMVCGLSTLSYADIPHLINYQGKLTDTAGKPVSDGSYSVTFRIYDVESGGSPLWEETQSVSVSKGIFGVMLGGVTALNLAFDKPYWLEIKVGTEVMSPRQRIASVGYAIRAQDANQAQNADKVDGCDAGTSANNVLKLTGSGTIPASAFKVYDSGWFAVTTGTAYTKTHNLGTIKFIATYFLSQSSDGSNAWLAHAGEHSDTDNAPGMQLQQVTTSACVLQTGANCLDYFYSSNGSQQRIDSGYARIILLALE